MSFSILNSHQGMPSGAAALAEGLMAVPFFFREMAGDILCPYVQIRSCYSKCGPCMSSIRITWELVEITGSHSSTSVRWTCHHTLWPFPFGLFDIPFLYLRTVCILIVYIWNRGLLHQKYCLPHLLYSVYFASAP